MLSQCSKENCFVCPCEHNTLYRRGIIAGIGDREKVALPPVTMEAYVANLLDFHKLGTVLDDAYADLFGVAPHIENETSTRNLLAKRILDLAQTGETDLETLKQYAMAGFALRNASMICAIISQSRPITLARHSRA